MNNDGGISICCISSIIVLVAPEIKATIVVIIIKMNSVLSVFKQSFNVSWIVYDAHTGKVPHYYSRAI